MSVGVRTVAAILEIIPIELRARDVRLEDEKMDNVKGNRLPSRQESRSKNRDVCPRYSYPLRPTFLS